MLKTRFSSLTCWFKGESIDFVRNLFDKNAYIYEFMDIDQVKVLVNSHLSGKKIEDFSSGHY